MMSAELAVLLVNDHALMRESYRRLIRAQKGKALREQQDRSRDDIGRSGDDD